MTSSCSTTLFAPSLPMKIVPYVPKACKPKPKPKPTPKAKSTATTKTAKHSRSGVDCKDGGEWPHTHDDFTMPGSNASLPTLYEASVGYGRVDAFAGLHGASGLQSPEHDQFGGEPLDEGGPDHPTQVAEGDLALIGLLGGISREFPLIVEGDAADHSATGVQPSNVASDCQEGGYRASAGNKEYVAVQHGNLNTDEVCALSIEEIESVRPNSPLAQDELLFGDVDVTDRPSTTRKQTRPVALDVIPEPLEDPRSTKRRRPAERLAENLVCNPAPTPKSTPLPTPGGSASYSRASTEPSLRSLDSDRERDGARTPRLSPSDLCTEDDGGDSAHNCRTSEGLLHSTRGSISPSESIEGEEYIGPDLERREKYREGGGGDASESHKDPRNQDDDISHRPSAKTPQRRTRGGHLTQKKRYGPSGTALGRQGSRTMWTRASRQVASSQPRQLYRPPIDNRPRSCSPQTSFRGTKARDRSNINCGSSLDMSCQITDLTLCAVPNGSSIIIKIIRSRDPERSPNYRCLGGEGKVIRMTQLSPDSWMLVGYRYESGAPGLCSCGSLNADWMSISDSNAANDGEDYLDDDGDDDDWDKNSEKEEGTEAHGKRKRRLWLESDEVRLLSLRDKQRMEWKEICKRFPNRTEGAVKVRYYGLQKQKRKETSIRT